MKRPYITSRQFGHIRHIAVTTSIALTLALGFGGQSAFAQRLAGDDRGSVSVAAQPEREITGAISGLGATTVSIGNQTVTIAGAEVQGALALGATVKLHVTVAADGSLAAREIVVLAPAASPSTPAAPAADDNGQDAAAHDAADDNGQDAAAHDAADDNGQDAAAHDATDDNGQGAASHDAADDNGQDATAGAPADDHGTDTASPSAPADDHGQDGATHNAGDDHGGSGGGHSGGSDSHSGGKHDGGKHK